MDTLYTQLLLDQQSHNTVTTTYTAYLGDYHIEYITCYYNSTTAVWYNMLSYNYSDHIYSLLIIICTLLVPAFITSKDIVKYIHHSIY